ncbi:unnamed protein product [Allacma fusca]|uniref:Uncharacterized protein n=1 Tax=Allacma fusca TaxID=39272 RepID=A0A8J2K008_9HEXA|nr:unnamed protein product [Allacma fusca]
MKDIHKVATPPATPPPASPKLNKKLGEAKKLPNLAKPTALKNLENSSVPQSPATPASKVSAGVKSAKSGKNIFGLQNRAKSKEEKRKSFENIKTDEETVSIVELHTNAVVSTGEDEYQISEDSGIEIMGKTGSEQEEKVIESSDWSRSSGNNNSKNATITQTFESFTVKSHVEIEEIVDTIQISQESKTSGSALSESLNSASSCSSSTTSVLPNPIVQGIIRDSLNRCSSEGSSGSVDGDSPPLTPKSSERGNGFPLLSKTNFKRL